MRTYGIDYSTKAVHLSNVENDRLLITVNFPLDELYGLGVMLESLGRGIAAVIPQGGQAWMESSWVGTNRSVFTGIQLARAATIIEVICAKQGINLNRVRPDVWRKALYGKRPKPGTAKQTALAYVLEHYGYETKDHNVAEAICLGVYGQQILKQEENDGE